MAKSQPDNHIHLIYLSLAAIALVAATFAFTTTTSQAGPNNTDNSQEVSP